MQQDSESLSLGAFLGVVRRRLPLVVLCFVVVAVAAHLYSKHQSKQYTATASIIFNNDSLSQELVGLPANNGNLLVQEAGNVASVQLGDMAAKTASLLGHGLTEAQVKSSLKVAALGESSSVAVAATSTSPILAATIANTYVKQFVAEQQAIDRRFFRSALRLVNKQLAALPAKQRLSPGAVALENRAQSLAFLSELQGGNVRVEQIAAVPTVPSSPKTSRNTMLGGVLGLLLGLGIAIMLERFHSAKRITDPKDLEEIFGVALLGTIPKSAELTRSARSRGRVDLSSEEAERFNLIRAHLRSFNADNDPHVVMVGSAASGEGRTTIARRLAESAARLGSRVLLLEADLRRPVLAEQFDIRSTAYLPDVLTGVASMEDAMCSIQSESSFAEGLPHRTFDVLAAGYASTPNSGALMDSHAMDSIIEQARSTYDFVVIDVPPLGTVSDAFPLLSKTDGVVIVGRTGQSERDKVERLHEILAGSSTNMLGIVANCTGATRRAGRGKAASPTRNDKTTPAQPSSNGASPKELVSPPTKV